MPFAPKRICSSQPCSGFAEVRGKCRKHAQQAERERGTSTERGYDSTWRKLRLIKLRASPLCEIQDVCKGLAPDNAATEVDHRIPIRDNPSLRLVWSNLQSSCVACNRAKQRRDKEARWK